MFNTKTPEPKTTNVDATRSKTRKMVENKTAVDLAPEHNTGSIRVDHVISKPLSGNLKNNLQSYQNHKGINKRKGENNINIKINTTKKTKYQYDGKGPTTPSITNFFPAVTTTATLSSGINDGPFQ